MYYLVILALIAMDWLTKHWIQSSMALNDTIPVIDGIFHITYIQNRGAAFSLLEGKQALLLTVTGAALILIVACLAWAHRKRAVHPVGLWAMALMAGGGLGNFIDRVRLGYVVDFLDVRVWPIFNVADIAVCCGCALMLFYVLILEPRLQKKSQNALPEEPRGPAV